MHKCFFQIQKLSLAVVPEALSVIQRALSDAYGVYAARKIFLLTGKMFSLTGKMISQWGKLFNACYYMPLSGVAPLKYLEMFDSLFTSKFWVGHSCRSLLISNMLKYSVRNLFPIFWNGNHCDCK